MIHGEALGLRGFMHFDLARLYCTDYTRSDANTLGLPLCNRVQFEEPHTLYLLQATFNLILDLNQADSIVDRRQ